MQFLRTIAKDAANVLFLTLAQIAARSGDIVEIFIDEECDGRIFALLQLTFAILLICALFALLMRPKRNFGVQNAG